MKLKKFAAAMLAAVLAVSSVPISGLAEPREGTDEQWWTVQAGAYKDDEGKPVTAYFANGIEVTIDEKGDATYMYIIDDVANESEWVELVAMAGDANYIVISGSAPDGEQVSSGQINMNGGTVGGLVGSCGEPGGMDQVEITVNDGIVQGGITIVDPIKQVGSFDNCGERYVEEATININGGKVNKIVRGTFSYSQVDNLKINVTGGEIGKDEFTSASIFGGSNGIVESCEINIAGGTVAGDVFASQRTLIDDFTINFTGGEVKGGIFPGSQYNDIDNASMTNGWAGWNIGDVNYGVTKNAKINVSGVAKYTDIFASFQNVSEDVETFKSEYSDENLYKALASEYAFDNLDTTTTITRSVEPGGRPASKYDGCISLTKETLDGVTVNTSPINIELNETAVELEIGESFDLNATLKKITGTVATDSNATIDWETSSHYLLDMEEDNVDNTKVKARAMGYNVYKPEAVIITASVTEGSETLSAATCVVTITKPELTVKFSPSKIAYDGGAKPIPTLTKVASPSDASFTYEAEAPAEVDFDNTVISDGSGIYGKAKITVNAQYNNFDIAIASNEIYIEQPKIKILPDDSTIDLKNTKELELFADSSCIYDDYKWTVSDPSLADIDGVDDYAYLTPKKTGTVTVTVEGLVYEDLVGMEGSDGAKATKVYKIVDSRKLAWKGEEPKVVNLYLNNEEKSDTTTLEIINDYGTANWSIDNETVAEVVPSVDGKTATLTAKAAGSAALTVKAEGKEEELSVKVLVIDSEDRTDIKDGETEVNVPDEVIDNVVIDINTEGLTEEQKQSIEENKAAIEEEIRTAIAEAAASVAANEAAKAKPTTGLDSAVRAAGILNAGAKVEVYLKHEVTDIEITTKAVVNEDGTVTAVPVITSMKFEITPYMVSLGSNGEKIEGTEQDISEHTNSTKQMIGFSIPVPKDITQNYAKIEHEMEPGKERTIKITKTDAGNYIRISVQHFSEFTITFTDEGPKVDSPSGGGARSSKVREQVLVEPGQWVQNESGWWYKYDNGTYPKTQWAQLPWNGVNNWYYFNDQGYLLTGWKQEGEHTYYLHPISDGTLGYLYTGWRQIDGKWYYFHTMEGGPLGAMLVNALTPDGFTVGADGVWIQ